MAFHVPERARLRSGPLASSEIDGNNGAFLVGSPEPGWQLVIIASDGSTVANIPWEHVSVRAAKSRASRVPSWREMCAVKDLFWDGEDVIVQFHPRRSEYVNNHPHVLHLWRPIGIVLPTPPMIAVGFTNGRDLRDQVEIHD